MIELINNNKKGLTKDEYVFEALKEIHIEYLEDDKDYYAECRQQGCYATGDTPEEALTELRETVADMWEFDNNPNPKKEGETK